MVRGGNIGTQRGSAEEVDGNQFAGGQRVSDREFEITTSRLHDGDASNFEAVVDRRGRECRVHFPTKRYQKKGLLANYDQSER